MAPPKKSNSNTEAEVPVEVIEHKVTVDSRQGMPPAAFLDPEMGRQVRAAQAEATRQQPAPVARFRERRETNLPTPGKFTAQLEAQNTAVAPSIKPVASFAQRKWFKFGVQPTERGYTLHVEYFEGDKKVKEVLKVGLTALGAREAAAMQLAAFWSTFA